MATDEDDEDIAVGTLPNTGTVHEVPLLDQQTNSSNIQHTDKEVTGALSSSTLHTKEEETHANEATSGTIELANNTSNNSDFNSTIRKNTHDEIHHGEYPNSLSVEIKHHAGSPVSPSDTEESHHKYPEVSPQPQEEAFSPSLPAFSTDDSHQTALAKKDHEEVQNRLQTAHKLGALNETTAFDDRDDDYQLTTMQTARITASTNLQNDDLYRIKKRFFHAYIRQDWHTFCVDDGLDEVRAGWVELFFDLIFVACIVHISAETAHNIVLPGEEDAHRRMIEDTECHDGRYTYILTAFAQFGLLTSFWMEQVMYTTHFVLDEHIDELLRLFYMTFVLAMGLFVANDAAYHIGFFCSYALLRVISCIMFFRVLWIPRARSHAIYHIILHTIIIVVLVALIAAKINLCAFEYFVIYLSLWIVEYGSGVLQWTLSDILCGTEDKSGDKIALPLNVPHIAERYGLFVMIILGEALIALMGTEMGELDLYQKFEFTVDGAPPDLVKVFFFLGIFILSYCVGRLYFNCQPSEEAILEGTKNHALRISKNRARSYIHSHMILFLALLGYGLGIKLAGKHVLGDQKYWIDILLPGYSLFVIVVCLNIIRVAHPFDANKKVWTFRFCIMLVLFVIPLFAKSDVINQAMIWGVQLLCILGLVATDVEGEHKKKDEKHHYAKKRAAAKEHMELKKKQEDEHNKFKKHLRHLVSGIGLL